MCGRFSTGEFWVSKKELALISLDFDLLLYMKRGKKKGLEKSDFG